MLDLPSTHESTHLDFKQLVAMQRQVAELAVRRRHIRSAMSGAHLSRLRGRGMEFDEVRIYQPGDDVGSIDWKVTARKGSTHVKLYHEERERPVLICLDYRRDMFFATKGALKSVVATKAAALLAWHGVQHGDRLGSLLFSNTEHHEMRPTRGRKGVLQFLHRCCVDKTWLTNRDANVTSLSFENMTQRLRQVSKPGSLIYILSDFRGLNDQSVADLVQLSKHNDVVLISVFDELERQFPVSGQFPVFDGKSYFNVFSNKKFQQQVKMKYEQHLDMIQTLQQQHGLHHIELATHDDVTTCIREKLWAI
ncbi:MAG: DUF58 domain-containing protein [Ghiorsea sp.]